MNKRLAALVAKNGVHQGNAVTDVQVSNFIRSTTEIECNGGLFEPGRLRQYDLDPYWRRYPFAVPMTQHHEQQTCVLYVWRTPHTTYGATLTDVDGKILRRTTLDHLTPRAKANALAAMETLETAAGLLH